MSQESITPLSTRDKSCYSEVFCLFNGEYDLKFQGICLKQTSMSFLHKNIGNIYIYIYILLTKYSDYSIGFDTRLRFSWTNEIKGKNVIIFGVDDSSSVLIDSRKKKSQFLVKD